MQVRRDIRVDKTNILNVVFFGKYSRSDNQYTVSMDIVSIRINIRTKQAEQTYIKGPASKGINDISIKLYKIMSGSKMLVRSKTKPINLCLDLGFVWFFIFYFLNCHQRYIFRQNFISRTGRKYIQIIKLWGLLESRALNMQILGLF